MDISKTPNMAGGGILGYGLKTEVALNPDLLPQFQAEVHTIQASVNHIKKLVRAVQHSMQLPWATTWPY